MHRSLLRALVLALLTLGVVLSSPLAFALTAGPMDGLAPDPTLDRGSPRRAVEGFLRAGGSGDTLRAAHYLDLRSIPAAEQALKGPVLAEQLWYVTTHIGRFDLLKISDDATAAVPAGQSALLVGTLDDRDGPIPIALERVKFPDGVERWIFSRSTLAMTPPLYAALARPHWAESLPAWTNDVYVGNAVWQWLGLALLIPLAAIGARVFTWLILGAFAMVARRTPSHVDDDLVVRLRRPMRMAVGAILYWSAASMLALTELVSGAVHHVTFTMLVVAGVWATLRGVDALAEWRQEHVPEGPGIELEILRRASHTRAALFERLAAMAVIVIGTAVALLQFEVVRGVGESLLASAGLAGVVLGFAAQRSLGAIIGGVQLSMSQPIRIGDSVFVEGDYGTVDHVFLTHVVVRRWDDRRVVLPVARFLDQSFQNLSKFGSAQTGVVTFTCEAGRSLAALRAELRRICTASADWDKRRCEVEMVDFTPSTMTLRALVSAADPLRCQRLEMEVREGLAEVLGVTGALGAAKEMGAVESERRPSAAGRRG